jgi:type IV pilus assembly protein PilC
LDLGKFAPVLLVTLLVLVLGGPVIWKILEKLGYSTAIVEWVLVPLPLIGPVLRANMVARWCDATKLGVKAGMDLPAAIELATDATRSARLAEDGRSLIQALSLGKPLTSAHTRILPATVPAAIQYASGHSDLAGTLGSLGEMYQRQAELRMSALPGILTPLLVLLIAIIIGFVIAALMMPFVSLISGMSGSSMRRKR